MSQRRSVRLGDILDSSPISVQIEDEEEYRQITVRMRGMGLVERGVLPGSQIRTKRQFRVSAGQWLVSKIDARNGAMGLVPAVLHDAIVTQDFPVFNLDPSVCVPEYFAALTSRSDFWDECLHASEGSTNRVRLKVDRFLDMTIELPPVAEQLRCVQVADRCKTAVESLANERVALGDVRQALVEHEILRMGSRIVRISDLVTSIKSGTSLRCHSQRAAAGQSGVLKLSAVQPGRFVATESKLVPAETPIPKAALLRGGEILVTRSNTLDRVGYACLVEDLRDRSLVCPDLIYRLTGLSDEVLPEFLVIALGLRAVRRQMKDLAVGTSDSMKKISIASLREIEIPLPSLEDQLTLTGRVRGLNQATEALEKNYTTAVALHESLSEGLLNGILEPTPINGLSEAA